MQPVFHCFPQYSIQLTLELKLARMSVSPHSLKKVGNLSRIISVKSMFVTLTMFETFAISSAQLFNLYRW